MRQNNYFFALSYGKFFKLFYVVYENVHEPEFVWKSDEHVKTWWMQGNAEGLFRELTINFQNSLILFI